MNQNSDWKPIAALVLAGLALFVALGAAGDYGNSQASTAPQQIIVQPVAPSYGTTGSTTAGGTAAPLNMAPGAQTNATHAWSGWGRWGGGPPIFHVFPLLFLAGFVLLVLWVIRRERGGWGGPGWYGRGWSGPGPGPQAPLYGQPYEQHPQAQSQPHGGYQQGQPTQATSPDDAHGDIARP